MGISPCCCVSRNHRRLRCARCSASNRGAWLELDVTSTGLTITSFFNETPSSYNKDVMKQAVYQMLIQRLTRTSSNSACIRDILLVEKLTRLPTGLTE